MPDKWNGDFLIQGGDSNGIVLAPLCDYSKHAQYK